MPQDGSPAETVFASAEDPDWLPPEINTGVAHSARVYNYLLGGKDNFKADREVGDGLIAAIPSAPVQARQHPLPDERTPILGQSPKDVKQKLPHGRRRIDGFCEGAEPDSARTQTAHDLDQVRQGTPETIELPDTQDIPWAEKPQACLEPRTVVAGSRCLVFMDVSVVDAGSQQSITLQIGALPIIGCRDSYVACASGEVHL